MLKNLHLIRHGITEGLEKQWYYGKLDLPVTERGRTELIALREKGIYPEISGCRIFTTGLMRTEQTLETIYGECEHEALPKLREMDFGDFEGYSYEDLKDREDYAEWLRKYSLDLPYPNGESANSFNERIKDAFDEFVEQLSTDAVLVAHGGTIASIMMYIFPEELPDFYSWIVEPGRGYTIHYDDGITIGYDAI